MSSSDASSHTHEFLDMDFQLSKTNNLLLVRPQAYSRLIKSCSDTPLCARMIFAQRYEDRRRLQPEDDSNTDLLDCAVDHPFYREGRTRQLVTLCHQRMYHYAGTYPLR